MVYMIAWWYDYLMAGFFGSMGWETEEKCLGGRGGGGGGNGKGIGGGGPQILIHIVSAYSCLLIHFFYTTTTLATKNNNTHNNNNHNTNNKNNNKNNDDLRVDENVVAFDVPVDDVVVVQILEAV